MQIENSTIIEVKESAVEDLLTRELELKDLSHLPFKKFTIQFPYRIFRTEEDTKRDIIGKIQQDKQLTVKDMTSLSKLATEYARGNVSLQVTETNGNIDVHLKDSIGQTLSHFSIMYMIPIPFIIKDTFSTNPQHTAMRLLKLIAELVTYINKPNTVKTKEASYNNAISGSSTNNKHRGKTNSKIYINKTIYKINESDLPPTDKRIYNRVQDSWSVRGHYRTYKSGKTVWVDSFEKGKKDTTPKDKKYQISHID